MLETRRATVEAEASRSNEIALTHGTQVSVLFASQDIYGPTVGKLFACYADVRQVVLEEAGYLPWLQSPDAFRAELYEFFDCSR